MTTLLKAVKRGDDRTLSMLFDMPVQVSGSTDKKGHTRAPYTRIQKVRGIIAAKDKALKEAIAHLTEDAQQPDIPAKEHQEDRAMIAKLKEAVAKPKWAQEPDITDEILARYPNVEDGTEGRVVQRHDGTFGALLWDTDADHPVGGPTIYADRASAEVGAQKAANLVPPVAQVVSIAPSKPEPVGPALTPEQHDMLAYAEHLDKPAVIMAAVALRHNHGVEDMLRAQVALATDKVPEAAGLTPGERSTAAWMASSLDLTHFASLKREEGGRTVWYSERQPIFGPGQIDVESLRDAILKNLGFGKRFLAHVGDRFTPEGLEWGALRAGAPALSSGGFDDRPAAWAARAKSYIQRLPDIKRGKYLLESSAFLTPKTPGEKAGVMAEIVRMGLATPDEFKRSLEVDFKLSPPNKKEVADGAPALEAIIAGKASLDDLLVYRLVGSRNQAKVQQFTKELRALRSELQKIPSHLDAAKHDFWEARTAAYAAAGWQEQRATSAFDRKQVFGLKAPSGGFIDLGYRSMRSLTTGFHFPGDTIHGGSGALPSKVTAILSFLETTGSLREPTAAETAAAQPREKRVVAPPAVVPYVPVDPAKRTLSPEDYYARGTKAEIDSGTKNIRTLMRGDLKQALAAGRLPQGIKVSITGDHNSINLRLTDVPAGMPVLNPDWIIAQVNDPHAYPDNRMPRFAPATQQVLDDLKAIHNKYNWDKSDVMSDYFHVNYYGGESVDYTLTSDRERQVPKPGTATLGATITLDGITYQLTGDPPRWHRVTATAAPVVKVVKVQQAIKAADPAKLRAIADALEAKAQASHDADRLANTPKRARQVTQALAQADRQATLAATVRNLAEAAEAGTVPHLQAVTSLAQVETLEGALISAMQQRDRDRWSYAERERQEGRPADAGDLDWLTWPRAEIPEGSVPLLVAALREQRGGASVIAHIRAGSIMAEDMAKMRELLGKDTADRLVGWYPIEQLARQGRLQRLGLTGLGDLKTAMGEYLTVRAGYKKPDSIKAAELALVGNKVGIDFFPTPKPLATRMAELAGVQPGARVLEPSAGHGSLADAARALGAEVDTIEISDALRAVLEAKGYPLVARDFQDFTPAEPYDAIVMNPPFSNRQDATHIRRAYDLLKPGGVLVAIAGEGVFFGSDQAAQAFRGWLEDREATVEKLPAGSFLDRTLPATTGVNARLIRIIKADDQPQEADYPSATAYLEALTAWRKRTGNRTAYDSRKEDRIDRLTARSDKASQESEARFNRFRQIGRRFEVGQPILVGHHSEKGARADIARMDNNMRAGLAAVKQAEDLSARAIAAEANTAISADDEDAVIKLKAKIEALEAKQAKMKAVNAAHARYLKDPASLVTSGLDEEGQARVRLFKPENSWDKHPYASYELTNNNNNLRSAKIRLVDLQRDRKQQAETGPLDPIPFTGGTLEIDTDLNRVQLFFGGKPDASIRSELKANGFRWAPSQGAWQRQLNAGAVDHAKGVLQGLGLLAKSHVKAHTRRLSSGKVVQVQAYTDKRTAAMDTHTLDLFGDAHAGPPPANQATRTARVDGQARTDQPPPRQPDAWDALADGFAPATVAGFRKRAEDQQWAPEFVAKLTGALGQLPPEVRQFFDYVQERNGLPATIVHRATLDGVPEEFRSTYANAAAITVNGSRIEFIEDRFPTLNSLRHELVHYAWGYFGANRGGLVGGAATVDAILKDVVADGEKMLKYALSKQVDPDPWVQMDAQYVAKRMRRMRAYQKKGEYMPTLMRQSLEMELMVGGGSTALAKQVGIVAGDADAGQYVTVALSMAMAARLGVTMDAGFASEEAVAYRCGEDEATTRRLFGGVADGMERDLVERYQPTQRQVVPELYDLNSQLYRLQHSAYQLSDADKTARKVEVAALQAQAQPLRDRYQAAVQDYARAHAEWYDFNEALGPILRNTKRSTPSLVKAYVHGHYRKNPRTGQMVWIESYTDKRATRTPMRLFRDDNHREAHFEAAIKDGKLTEAMHVFHDLDVHSAHRIAQRLGLHRPGDLFHTDKKKLMAAIHGRAMSRRDGEPAPPKREMLDFSAVTAEAEKRVGPNATFEIFDHLPDRSQDKDPTWSRGEVYMAIQRLLKVGIDAQHRATTQALLAANGGSPLGLEVRNPQRDRYALVLPDASNPGKYRSSQYDKHGLYTHETFATADAALAQLIKDGFTEHAPGSMDELSQTETWRQGMEAAFQRQAEDLEYRRRRRAA